MSRKLPRSSFISFVRWNSPEPSDTMLRPKLGSQLPGTAKPKLLIEVSSNSRTFSNMSSFWSMRCSPAGFHSIPSASSAVATNAPPRPSVRAPA